MPEFSPDEAALLARAAGGDETAFGVLYTRHAGPIYRFASRLLGDAAAAEDVTHDCFLSLLKQPGRFDPACGSLRTYLYGAARNYALKRFRRQGCEVSFNELIDEPADEEARGAPLERLLNDELGQAVQRAVQTLPPLQREALILFEYEELPLAEIAAVVGAEVGTIKARLHRARRRLRILLNAYLGDRDRAGVGVSEEHQHV